MSTNRSSSSNQGKSTADQEWENRVLCSDGNCIGVIGADGCCKECGKPYEGRLPTTAAPEAASPSQPADADSSAAPADESGGGQQAAGGDDWDNRVLCSDGNCIGLIGPDGRCKECGKPYTPESTQ